MNIGFDGNTPQANLSPSQLVQVLSPVGLEKFEIGQQVSINWRSLGLTGTVDIDLLQQGNPMPVASIAQGASDTGSFSWTIPQGIALGNEYQIRVTIAGQQALSSVFQIVSAGTDYYVNDASTAGDVFTTAVGNNANDGKSPDDADGQPGGPAGGLRSGPGGHDPCRHGQLRVGREHRDRGPGQRSHDHWTRFGHGPVEPRDLQRLCV